MNPEFLDRPRSVESEYLSCRAALAYAVRAWADIADEPEWQGRRRSQSQEALRRLEDTYLIRVFAELEAILRHYWSATDSRPVPARVEDVINRLGSRHRVPQPIRLGVRVIQARRNALLHRGARQVAVVAFGDARRALNRFLAALPDT